MYYISSRYRGVLVTLGKVDQHLYVNGIGFKVPFVSMMYKMDVRIQKMSQKTSTYTSDVQRAEVEYVFTYDLCRTMSMCCMKPLVGIMKVKR